LNRQKKTRRSNIRQNKKEKKRIEILNASWFLLLPGEEKGNLACEFTIELAK
jgi:hypothetical protein